MKEITPSVKLYIQWVSKMLYTFYCIRISVACAIRLVTGGREYILDICKPDAALFL
jgi:hypothetical protein